MDLGLRALLDDLPTKFFRIEDALDDGRADGDLPDTRRIPAVDINTLNWQVWGYLKCIAILTRKITTHGLNLAPQPFPVQTEDEITKFLDASRAMVSTYRHVYPNPFQIPSVRFDINYNLPFMLHGELFSTMDDFKSHVRAMMDTIANEKNSGKRDTYSTANLQNINPSIYMPWSTMKKIKHVALFLRFDQIGHNIDFTTFYNFFTYKDTRPGNGNRDMELKDGLLYTNEPHGLETLSLFFMRGHNDVQILGRPVLRTVADANAYYLGDAATRRLTMRVTSQAARVAVRELLVPEDAAKKGDRIKGLCDIFRQFPI